MTNLDPEPVLTAPQTRALLAIMAIIDSKQAVTVRRLMASLGCQHAEALRLIRILERKGMISRDHLPLRAGTNGTGTYSPGASIKPLYCFEPFPSCSSPGDS